MSEGIHNSTLRTSSESSRRRQSLEDSGAPSSESDVRRFTRRSIQGALTLYSVEWMGSDLDRLEITECTVECAERIVAESRRDDVNQAGQLLIWQAFLAQVDADVLSLSVNKTLLAFSWTVLHTLRGQNHTKGRCSHGPYEVPDSETPFCHRSHEQNLDGALSPDASYNPTMDVDHLRNHASAVVDRGEPCYINLAAAPSLAVEDIADFFWMALFRLLTEIEVSGAQEEEQAYGDWLTISQEGIATIRRYGQAVAMCLLLRAWDDLIGFRSMNHHDLQRCRHFCENQAPCPHEP